MRGMTEGTIMEVAVHLVEIAKRALSKGCNGDSTIRAFVKQVLPESQMLETLEQFSLASQPMRNLRCISEMVVKKYESFEYMFADLPESLDIDPAEDGDWQASFFSLLVSKLEDHQGDISHLKHALGSFSQTLVSAKMDRFIGKSLIQAIRDARVDVVAIPPFLIPSDLSVAHLGPYLRILHRVLVHLDKAGTRQYLKYKELVPVSFFDNAASASDYNFEPSEAIPDPNISSNKPPVSFPTLAAALEILDSEVREGENAEVNPKVPPGMINIGSTCFSAAILQCLLNLPLVSNALISLMPTDAENAELIEYLKILGYEAQHSTSPMDPSNFWKAFRKLCPMYEGAEEDAHEFFSRLVSQLGPMENIFSVKLFETISCDQCSNKSQRTIDSIGLVATLPERDAGNSSKLLLQKLLDDSLIYAVNERVCEQCAEPLKAHVAQSVAECPPILVISTPRFGQDHRKGSKNQLPVEIPDRVVLRTASGDATYTLRAICNHIGSSVQRGHYVAVVRADAFECWLEFDDAHVGIVPPPQKKSPKGDTYVLFFELDGEPKIPTQPGSLSQADERMDWSEAPQEVEVGGSRDIKVPQPSMVEAAVPLNESGASESAAMSVCSDISVSPTAETSVPSQTPTKFSILIRKYKRLSPETREPEGAGVPHRLVVPSSWEGLLTEAGRRLKIEPVGAMGLDGALIGQLEELQFLPMAPGKNERIAFFLTAEQMRLLEQEE
ncbi:hypothetical protein DFJ73DRAFT_39101 [Zopfochytrium polystomum]|nr:hypothetical protein DFJ73DRAFT_39101 [Zopfochytrium polystomum]